MSALRFLLVCAALIFSGCFGNGNPNVGIAGYPYREVSSEEMLRRGPLLMSWRDASGKWRFFLFKSGPPDSGEAQLSGSLGKTAGEIILEIPRLPKNSLTRWSELPASRYVIPPPKVRDEITGAFKHSHREYFISHEFLDY
ncbi:MAG TPA: hypothetical protein VGO11_14720 [Chthoniobacteraceae bacterium]|jgi:hypothetical protein|nr:hypothetical protein [Chthoniobacteraceae bacterium]